MTMTTAKAAPPSQPTPPSPRRTLRKPRPPTPWQIVIHFGLLLLTLSFITPLLLVVSASLSSEQSITDHGYTLIPMEFSDRAYRYIIGDPSQLIQAYGVTILVTAVGTFCSVLIMAMLAYVLSRRDFKPRRALSFYVLFTMLFGGGLAPFYILITQYLNIDNTLLALILPHLVVAWNVLLLRTFFMQLPVSIIEAARIDGAGDLRLFFQIALPMSTPAIATIGMFTMLMYWNEWWLGLLFINDPDLNPVQLYLYKILTNIDALTSNPELGGLGNVPTQSVRMAIAVLAIGPILFAFAFVQKYFVRGITLGGVRE